MQPISAAMRRTALFTPQPHPLASAEPPALLQNDSVQRCLHPVEVLVQLEGSGEDLYEEFEDQRVESWP